MYNLFLINLIMYNKSLEKNDFTPFASGVKFFKCKIIINLLFKQ